MPSTTARYTLRGEAPAGSEHIRVLAHDAVLGVDVELFGLKRHVWLRPGAREQFATRRVPPPQGLEILGETEHDGLPAVVRPRVVRTFRALRLSPEEALATLRWLGPALIGSPFRGRLTADDIWLDLQGTPRLFGLCYPEDVRLLPPAVEPPEMAGPGCDPHSDLYALGAILYEAVSGKEPSRPPRDLTQITTVSADASVAIMQLLSVSPAGRANGLEPGDPPVIALPASLATTSPVHLPVLPVQRQRWEAAVVINPSELDPSERARLAVIAGVPVAAIERAAKRELDFVIGAYADGAEAERITGRFTRRGLAATLVNTRAPPVVHWGLTWMLALGLGVASSGNVRLAFFAMAAALFAVVLARLSASFKVAKVGLAIVDRLQAGFSEDVAGEAASTRALLVRADMLPARRTPHLEALDAAVDDLAELAVREVASAGAVKAADRRAAEAAVAEAVREARGALGEPH